MVADLPEGSSVEETSRLADRSGRAWRSAIPEVHSVQTHAGEAAPFNFNGLVRHYYIRNSPELGDVQITLAEKSERDRTSHEIALELREKLKALALKPGTSLKVVEPPPGPPVLATLLAEIYGPDPETRRKTAEKVREAFGQGALRRRHRRQLRPADAAHAHRHRPGQSRIPEGRGGRRL